MKISMNQQQMVTGTPCKPEPIIPKRNTVPGMPVEATNRHYCRIKVDKIQNIQILAQSTQQV